MRSQRTCKLFSSILCCRARSLKHKELSEYDLRKLEAEGDKKDRDRKIQGRIEVRSSVPQESKAERLPEHQSLAFHQVICEEGAEDSRPWAHAEVMH